MQNRQFSPKFMLNSTASTNCMRNVNHKILKIIFGSTQNGLLTKGSPLPDSFFFFMGDLDATSLEATAII